MTRAQARELVLDGGRAHGVRFWHGDVAKVAYAEAEVILAAGSIGSPQLLELSGIGRGDVLQRAGLRVRHALDGVGENLHDHLQIRPVYRVHDTVTLNQRAGTWLGQARMALEYALFRRGPLTMAPSQLGAFARADPDQATPNLEYHVQPLSTDKLGDPLHPFPGLTPSVCHLRPESRGSTHIADAEPGTPPAIHPNYLATEGDRRVAADALRLTRRIMGARALAPYRPEELKPGPEITDDDGLARAAGDIGTTIFHPVGTCAMGPDPAAGAVVDPSLRVHGLARLRVVDASIMPRITSGNTNSPTLMIAEKGAALIRAARRG
jgi:choline dehydrogenase